MVLSPMRFGDYVWPHNPRVYEILYERDLVCHKVPMGKYLLQNMGMNRRILRGEGEFFGSGAYDEFKRLACAFYKDEPQILVHPVWMSTKAYFTMLRLKQEPKEDFVSYEFEFCECFDGYSNKIHEIEKPKAEVDTPQGMTDKKTYILKFGDTLWGIARSNGLTLQQLLNLNPQIRNPNIYYAGDVIYLS